MCQKNKKGVIFRQRSRNQLPVKVFKFFFLGDFVSRLSKWTPCAFSYLICFSQNQCQKRGNRPIIDLQKENATKEGSNDILKKWLLKKSYSGKVWFKSGLTISVYLGAPTEFVQNVFKMSAFEHEKSAVDWKQSPNFWLYARVWNVCSELDLSNMPASMEQLLAGGIGGTPFILSWTGQGGGEEAH